MAAIELNKWLLFLILCFVLVAIVFYSQGWRVDVIVWQTIKPEDFIPLGING